MGLILYQLNTFSYPFFAACCTDVHWQLAVQRQYMKKLRLTVLNGNDWSALMEPRAVAAKFRENFPNVEEVVIVLGKKTWLYKYDPLKFQEGWYGKVTVWYAG
jgi:hypothetical protein